MPSEGTYFLTVDISSFGGLDDETFCRNLVTRFGVAAIPVSAFYTVDPVKSVVRFCFAKHDATLDRGRQRLDRALSDLTLLGTRS